MKKLILLLLCTATLGLVSCKKDTILQPAAKTYNFTIQPNQWVSVDNGERFSFEWNRAEIDQVTVDDEGVLVYFSHPLNSGSYIQLPYTFDAHAFSYELYKGGIAFDIQTSDNQDLNPTRPAYPITVKVVVIPSTYIP